MQTTRFGKHILASGLAWVVLDPHGGGKHRQIQQWRNAGQTHGVAYEISGEEVYGRANAEGLGTVSVAAMAARHPDLRGRTALLLIEIPAPNAEHESTVLAVGLNRGFVELDRQVYASDVASLRNSFASQISKQYELHGDGEHVGEIEHQLTLDELIKGGRPGSAKLKPLRSGRMAGIAIGALICAGLAGGLWVWWGAHTEARRLAAQAELEASKTPQVLYQQAIAQYLAKPVVPLADAMAAVRVGLQDFPTVFAGWNLSKVNCNVDGCTALWLRLGDSGGTLDDFRSEAAAKHGWGPVTAISQTEVAHAIPLVLPTISLARQGWPKMSEWRDLNLARWQFLASGGWRADLTSVKLIAVPPELAGGPQEAALGAVPEAIRAAEMSITSMPFWYADADPDSPMAVEYIGPQTALLGDIQVDVSSRSVTYSAKGLIHVQN